MINTTSTPVNGDWSATLPASLAAGIAPAQSACLGCICTAEEQAALDEWLAACPAPLVYIATPVPHLITQPALDEHQARKRDAIAALVAKGGAK